MTERFELLEQLGRGGMGTVWKARDAESGGVIALKLLHEQYADDPYFVERFEREVEVTRKIDSPCIVKMFGYGKRAGRPYLAMEYVEGRSLKDIVRDRPLTWPEARALLRQVSRGLDAAEKAGVIHRDVKPSNILVSEDGTAKLVDFGIAKAADMTALTGMNTTIGTPAYMAPEGKPSVQADLYGLGCVAYEMLTGAPPFTGDSQGEVLLKHMREIPDLAKLPDDARNLVAWLLQKEPKRRPGSAAVVVAVLEGTGSAPRRGASQALTWKSRRSAIVGGSSVLVAVLVVFGGIFSRGGPPDTPLVLADGTSTHEEARSTGAQEGIETSAPGATLATPTGQVSAVSPSVDGAAAPGVSTPIPSVPTIAPGGSTATSTSVPPTSTLAPTAAPTAFVGILRDDFSNAATGLMQSYQAADRSVLYSGGALVFEQSSPSTRVGAGSKSSYSNTVFDFDVELVGPQAGVTIAVDCRFQQSSSGTYGVRVDVANQQFKLVMGGADGVYKDTVPWTSNPGVKRNGSNHVRLSCVGPTVSASANGSSAISATDTTWSSGTFLVTIQNFQLMAGVKALVTNLQVTVQ